jgi:tetratricopeptide (TPR) repeat protein
MRDRRSYLGMKNRGFIFVAVVTFLCGLGKAIQNPIGPPTVPPSSLGSGLVPSPDPFDASGEQVISGNVAGGRHFRGPVPYGSTTGFRAGLGSTSLDSFLRYSAGTTDPRGYTGRYQPFYSPSGTVTITRPGVPDAFRPADTRVSGRANTAQMGLAGDRSALAVTPEQQALSSLNIRPSSLRFQLRSVTPQDLEKLLLEGLATDAQAKKLVREENLGQMEQLQRELEEVSDRTPQLKESLISREDRLRLYNLLEPREKAESATEQMPPAPRSETGKDEQLDVVSELKKATDAIDAYDRARRESEDMRAGRELRSISAEESAARNLEEEYSVPQSVRLPSVKSAYDASGAAASEKAAGKDTLKRMATVEGLLEQGQPTQQGGGFGGLNSDLAGAGASATGLAGMREQRRALLRSEMTRPDLEPGSAGRGSAVDALGGVDISAKAQEVLGPYEDIESFTESKFDQYIKAAERYLNAGRYYRAVDSYTMALIYRPNDAAAQAGKSHALLAAGEYISSALFLSRALVAFPEYARFKLDLVAVMGDRDKLESRIADIERWLKESHAPQLQFLLGYVYYQTGRLDRAKEAIEAAYQGMPDSPAVGILKKAIDDAMVGTKPASR